MTQLVTSGPRGGGTTEPGTHERESLAGTIARIDPAECPIYANMKKAGAKATREDWTVQELNVQEKTATRRAEGSTFQQDPLKVPDRFDNFTEIRIRDGEVSGTFGSIDTVSGQREFRRQQVLQGLALRRDIEHVLTSNYAKAGPAGTRICAGFQAWVTNVAAGVGGAAPTGDGSDVAVPGTDRAWNTAAYIDDVHQQAFQEGGNPRIMYMTPGLKTKFSDLPDAWAPGTEHRVNASQPAAITFVGAADAYRSDFGVLQTAMSRWMEGWDQTTQHVEFHDPKYVEWKTLPRRNFVTEMLGKVGDSSRFQVICEGTLCVSAPKAHGCIHALDPALV